MAKSQNKNSFCCGIPKYTCYYILAYLTVLVYIGFFFAIMPTVDYGPWDKTVSNPITTNSTSSSGSSGLNTTTSTSPTNATTNSSQSGSSSDICDGRSKDTFNCTAEMLSIGLGAYAGLVGFLLIFLLCLICGEKCECDEDGKTCLSVCLLIAFFLQIGLPIFSGIFLIASFLDFLKDWKVLSTPGTAQF